MANNTVNTGQINTAQIEKTKQSDLKSILRIMDVASELRRQRELAEGELNLETEKGKIREKIRQTAELTGEDLTEEEINVAIKNFYDGLYRYKEPNKGISYYLAKLYISRGKIFKFLLLPIMLLSAVFFGGDKFKEFQNTRKQTYLSEQIQTLPTEAEKVSNAIKSVTSDSISIEETNRELNKIKTAKLLPSKIKAVNEIEASIQNLKQILANLQVEYDVLISTKKTGVDRYYSDEQGRRVSGYYIVVNAKDKSGNPIAINILNKETDKQRRVNTWAERVSKDIYDKVRRDKIDNGIIDERLFAKKERGKRDLTILYKNSYGEQITREAQITNW